MNTAKSLKSNDDLTKSKVGKRFSQAMAKVEGDKLYKLADALKLLPEISTAKFDESVDMVFKLGIDPVREVVRGSVSLPHGSGKAIKIAVITKPERESEAKEAGADFYNQEEIMQQIKSGKIAFDVCIATPDMMGVVGSVARILGPKGLMPSPRSGTVATDIKASVNKVKLGVVQFRAEKAGLVHVLVGKVSFSPEKLLDNINETAKQLFISKPKGSKGVYLRKAYLSSTMGPAMQVDLADFAQLS